MSSLMMMVCSSRMGSTSGSSGDTRAARACAAALSSGLNRLHMYSLDLRLLTAAINVAASAASGSKEIRQLR
jgi:hypothetical protein